jgi:hypothetical protein
MQHVRRAVALDGLNAPLDLANRVDVVPDFRAVGRAKRRQQAAQFFRDGIENAPVLARLPEPLGRRASIAEQALENHARVVLDGHRRGRRAPRQRVQIDAAVPVVAASREITEVDPELERRERSVLPERVRRDLIGGDRVPHVGALGVSRVDAGEPRAGAARMVPVGSVSQHVGLMLCETADRDHLIPERREGRQDRRELEVRAFTDGPPVVHADEVHRDAVGQVDEAEAAHSPGRRRGQCRQRRHHRVEQRQRQRGAQAAQEGAAWQRHPGDEHVSFRTDLSQSQR